MKKTMKRMMVLLLAALMVTAGTPQTAHAAAKKSVTVTVRNAAAVKGKTVTVVRKKKCQVAVSYGKKNVTKKAKYKTSNKKVATVSKKGVVTAKKKGTATLTVKYKGKTKKLKVKVQDPVLMKAATKPAAKKPASSGKTHTHKWVEKTQTQRVWAKDVHDEDVYEYYNTDYNHYSCGAKLLCVTHVDENGNFLGTTPEQKACEEHAFEHLLKGELNCSQCYTEPVKSEKVKVGTRKVDNSHWENKVVKRWKECSCGAVK